MISGMGFSSWNRCCMLAASIGKLSLVKSLIVDLRTPWREELHVLFPRGTDQNIIRCLVSVLNNDFSPIQGVKIWITLKLQCKTSYSFYSPLAAKNIVIYRGGQKDHKFRVGHKFVDMLLVYLIWMGSLSLTFSNKLCFSF